MSWTRIILSCAWDSKSMSWVPDNMLCARYNFPPKMILLLVQLISTVRYYIWFHCTCHTDVDTIALSITGGTLTENGLSIPALGNSDLDVVLCIIWTGGIVHTTTNRWITCSIQLTKNLWVYIEYCNNRIRIKLAQ